MTEPTRATFSPPRRSSPPELTAFRTGVTAAIDAGAQSVAIELDDIEVLDSMLLASLIAILRHARERAATVVLCASRAPITDTLRVTALDKVFTIEKTANRLVA